MQLSASIWTPTDLRTQTSLMMSRALCMWTTWPANSKPDQASAYEFCTKLKSRFQEGGFNIRKWLTNDPILSATINSQEDHDQVKVQPLAELQEEDQNVSQYVH